MGQDNSPNSARFENKMDFSKIYHRNSINKGKPESIYIY